MTRTSFLTLALILTLSITGCRGCYSFTGGRPPSGAETVSVQLFENEAQIVVPTLSQSFSEALKDRFIAQTNLTLLATNGDLSFSGAITSYTIKPVAIQGNETAAQNRLTITVKVDYECKPTPEKGWSQTFSQFADFSSSDNLSTVETQLITDINEKLTLDIFNKVLSDW